jgi:hypothetical protein
VPFHHLPVTAATKPRQEAKLRALIDDDRRRARDPRALHAGPVRCARARPRRPRDQHPPRAAPELQGREALHQAYDRGVKLIGATAHYVTSELDEGPIIDQEVARVDYTMRVDDLVALGRDVECLALARAVKFHLERRVFLNGAKTSCSAERPATGRGDCAIVAVASGGARRGASSGRGFHAAPCVQARQAGARRSRSSWSCAGCRGLFRLRGLAFYRESVAPSVEQVGKVATAVKEIIPKLNPYKLTRDPGEVAQMLRSVLRIAPPEGYVGAFGPRGRVPREEAHGVVALIPKDVPPEQIVEGGLNVIRFNPAGTRSSSPRGRSAPTATRCATRSPR